MAFSWHFLFHLKENRPDEIAFIQDETLLSCVCAPFSKVFCVLLQDMLRINTVSVQRTADPRDPDSTLTFNTVNTTFQYSAQFLETLLSPRAQRKLSPPSLVSAAGGGVGAAAPPSSSTGGGASGSGAARET